MKRWIKKLDSVFVSIAFAEMDEFYIYPENPQVASGNLLTLWDDLFVAVTFAEAGY